MISESIMESLMAVDNKIATLRAENERLKAAIRRLAERDATLSVQGGSVTVEMDGP